jgi:TetR/AcrR family transcriptional regulator
LLNDKQGIWVTISLVRPDRERNATRSREQILDAAELLFAERGYGATSLSEVGNHSGLSRATPGYFFGAKADLYRAVLERCFAEARRAVLSGRDRALASRETPEVILTGVIRDYFDFLAARPTFVRLMEREALGDGPPWEGPGIGVATGQAALAAIVEELGFDAGRSEEAAHLLISMVALCWFPLVHADTMINSLGLDTRAPAFAEARKRHVVDLILNGVAGRLTPTSPLSDREAGVGRYPD